MNQQGTATRWVDVSPGQREDTRCGGEPLRRASLRVRGVVQGVGFRPFIYHLARRHGVKGWVCNRSGDVKIDAEGPEEALNAFLAALEQTPPPRAELDEVILSYSQPKGYRDFEIRKSVAQSGRYQHISNDISTCPQCLAEVLDPGDRRHGYAFTNCTHCGPRFTILEDIPYDRPNTTMRSFKMCVQCEKEYEDPLDRRFHAQPNACPACGPSLALTDPSGRLISSEAPISEAARLLKEGNILALKGLGGFLLACDATNGQAVRRLRKRKNRPSKPLATMMATIEEIQRFCHTSGEEKELLASPQSPIVLLKIERLGPLSPEVAPDLKTLGVMLPYTPLHHLLLRKVSRPLVMTSGNVSGEPIVKDNVEALNKLGRIADAFLMHNRDIVSPCDDSVTVIEEGRKRVWRRARGYAPRPIRLGFRADSVLAFGADLKNSFCVTREGYAFLSPHIGELENLATLDHFERTLDLYKRLFSVEPKVLAHDAHPDYLSTQFAKGMKHPCQDLRLVPVQHHHAHIVSCMAEHQVSGPVLGVAFDGTGYGEDGQIWGGEFLYVEHGRFRRLGHLEVVPMPGGAGAIRKPYRMALGYLLALLGEEALEDRLPPVRHSGRAEIALIRKQVETGLNAPLTSSAGRLFDAVSALIGVRQEVDYEAQAAVELEAASREEGDGEVPYPFRIDQEGGVRVVRLGGIFQGILKDLSDGIPKSEISCRFHHTMAGVVLQMCEALREDTGIRSIALSGGVFQNRLFHTRSRKCLKESGFQVYSHEQVPCNDGGVALGQAVVASRIVNGE